MSSSYESYNTLAIYRIEVNPSCLCRDQPASEKLGNLTTQISNDSCNFFRWLDPVLPKHYKDTLWNMKLRINDLLVRNGQVVELQKKVEKHKLLRKVEKELVEAM
ncbi:unnamed protein product [Lactuca virosa]|uniref:Uncharacterized protein n=1 Tax=Lactuca virosa TaxID=75947 RepID=A0AAU9P0W2_9ASTR|nr:unnamed protein product [Lactuca virosa]